MSILNFVWIIGGSIGLMEPVGYVDLLVTASDELVALYIMLQIISR